MIDMSKVEDRFEAREYGADFDILNSRIVSSDDQITTGLWKLSQEPSTLLRPLSKVGSSNDKSTSRTLRINLRSLDLRVEGYATTDRGLTLFSRDRHSVN